MVQWVKFVCDGAFSISSYSGIPAKAAHANYDASPVFSFADRYWYGIMGPTAFLGLDECSTDICPVVEVVNIGPAVAKPMGGWTQHAIVGRD